MKHTGFIILLLSAFYFSSCEKPEVDYSVQVHGTVIDAVTGAPVPAAEIRNVTTTSSPYGSVITVADSMGKYQFEYKKSQVQEGTFNFVVAHSGYGAYHYCQTFYVSDKSDVTSYDLLLRPDVYLSMPVSKTSTTDSAIEVTYTEGNWYQHSHSVRVTDANSTDTLTIRAIADIDNTIYLSIKRYHYWGSANPYTQVSNHYTVHCSSADTTYYSLNY